MDATNLKIWLPFDTSTTLDRCGGTWTAYGNPTIQDGNLFLDGASYLQLQGGLDLGGQDFTIRLYVNASNSGTAVYIYNDEIEDGLVLSYLPQGLNHIEIDYVQDAQTFYMFVNGVLSSSMEWDIFATRRNYKLILGFSEYDYFSGTIDDFIVYDGTALHTEDFTLTDDTDSNSDKLIVHLPFDENTTQDLCGNTWTAYGNPTAAENNAVSGKALQLTDGQYLELNETITIGGQDFTICGYCNFSSSSGSYARIFEMAQTAGSYTNVFFFGRYLRGTNFVCAPNYNMSSGTGIWNERFQFTIVYSHAKSTLQWYLNDELKNTVTEISIARVARKLRLGSSLGSETGNFIGTIDDFKIYDGVALRNDTKPWTKEISQSYDVVCHVAIDKPWKLYNLGTADGFLINGKTLTDLPISQSKTGTAFNQVQFVKCFDIPASDEIWLKFDVYGGFDEAGNDSATFAFCGIRGIGTYPGKTLGRLGIYGYEGNGYQKGYDVLSYDTLQTFLLHLKSAKSGGVIEVWLDGEFLGRHTGNVNDGNLLEDICLRGGMFSNIMVSNVQIDFEEGWQEFLFDVERVKGKTISFTADVSRNIKAKFKLYATDNTQYFSGGTSAPIVIPTQDTIPPAYDSDANMQSIEISLREQQLTDQVKLVGISPLDIMFPVQGQYLDYVCDMRVEKVQRQGILFSAECCIDIDEILYTPLNYDMPYILSQRYEQGDVEQPKYILVTFPALASQHVEKIAAALDLVPVMQFDDFYSSVEYGEQKISGASYNDLIRDIFGWSSRVPTMMINVYIRNGKLFVIQRGHEANVIDITDADKTRPIFTRELVRTFYQRNKFDATMTFERKRRKKNPTAHSTEISPDSDTDSAYDYDNSGLLKKSVTTTTDSNGDKIRTETEYKYTTLDSGQKVLVKETIEKYVNGVLDETTEIKHTPLKQGLSHQIKTDEDGDIIGEAVGQNTSDDRVSPYAQSEEDDNEDSVTDKIIIEGLTLFDTSFPIPIKPEVDTSHWEEAIPPQVVEIIDNFDTEKGLKRLQQITEDIKWLNRKTRETVTLSIYNFPHLIDFNDRIVLDGVTYFLISNRATTTPRIFNEQALTLVRWF